MKNGLANRISGIIFLLGLILISGCDKKAIPQPGFLEGTISIGPLCPVQTDPPAPGCLPTAETYKAYPVSVWTLNESVKIAQINPALDGTYKVELAPGTYKIILERPMQGIGNSGLPVEVTIQPGSTSILNINIDTGIR